MLGQTNLADGLRKSMEVFRDHSGNRNTPLDLVLLLSYSAPSVEVGNTLNVTETMKRVCFFRLIFYKGLTIGDQRDYIFLTKCLL